MNDVMTLSQKADVLNCTPSAATVAFFGTGANGFGYCLDAEQKLTNFGTARARAGYLSNPWLLWYVTGGVAWAEVNDTFTGSTSNPMAAFNGTSASFSKTKSGGTVGAGVETRLWGGWSAKIEYLYVNLGSTDRAFTTTNVLGDSATLASNHSLNDHMVRLGLNYRFW